MCFSGVAIMASYSGFWEDYGGLVSGVAITSAAHTLLVNRSPINRRVSQALRRRSLTALREKIDTVVASSSINGAAAVTREQVPTTVDPGSPGTGGGVRANETVTIIAASSSTSAADATEVDNLVDYSTQPTYPTDPSGNGGGGKLGLL
jgi:hypothetical protein